MAETNPNGANGTTSDPREQKTWDIYVANLSKGIENAYKAAVEAGYSKDHAENITIQGWFKERKAKLKRKDMLSKSEKVLDETLDMPTLDKEGLVDPQLLKIKVDVAKTIATTLGKEEGYSTRSELTGKDGKDLKISFDPIFEK
ncbi:MAG TPA: hypothetical protein PKV66_00180 [Candidatus Pelethenecus sp.]|nr:hypothetical protein [Candidatus Pelethenecus sp.]